MALGIVGSVLLAAAVLFLYVEVTLRFDGRLWMLPARVYSDTLVLTPGRRASATQLVNRLDRCGFARRNDPPSRPGQYRRHGSVIDVYTRDFDGVGGRRTGQRLRIDLAGERVRSIREESGPALDRAEFEPELLASLYGPRQEDRQPLPFAAIPRGLIDAVLAAEDARFFQHHGLDLRGILRAGWVNLREGQVRQGGSTVTQQTVKNLFLNQERSWWRKLREGAMSLIVDARYSKPKILEVYLNEVYLGQRGSVAICGVQAASRFYFGRDVEALSLAEFALMAGLIQSPGRHNPFLHPQAARERRDGVLRNMLRLGLASDAEVEAARAEPLRLASGRAGYRDAGYAVDFVRAQLAAHFSEQLLREEGLHIHTTLDTLWQEAVERALRAGLERLERTVSTVNKQRDRRRLQGAVVVTDPSEGAVLALVGGRDYAESQFNRATRAMRQPGSCFKPIVYAAGLASAERGDEAGLTTASLLDDSPFEVVEAGRRWAPSNYDRTFRGEVSLRRAIEDSLNVPAVRAARQVGLARVVEVARRCGIESPMAAVPSLALGTSEVTPLELAGAYGSFASGGRHNAPWIVREVQDRQGKTLARRRVDESRAVSPFTAFLVNDLLRGVLERGTARAAANMGYVGRGAGKTGTTDHTRDAWFVGYTPRRLALVWVGYDDNVATGLTGATGALPIWVDAMKAVDDPHDPADFNPPSGMLQVEIDPTTGQAAAGCPETLTEWFAPGTEPLETCRLHGPGRMRRWFDRLFRREATRRGPLI